MFKALIKRPLFSLASIALVALTATPAFGQEPTYKPGQAVTDVNPMPVKNRCWSGTAWAACATGGGGGTADSTAANQASQIALEQAIRDEIGALTTPAAGSTNNRLGLINTTLGSPFQVGGSIGNTAFGISGTLPPFAAPPTVNLGTLNGAATASNQTSQIALASAYQSVSALTVGTTAAAGRGWKAVCTAAGNASLVLAGGGTDVVPLNIGLTIIPYAVTQVATSGTTATCTYANLN